MLNIYEISERCQDDGKHSTWRKNFVVLVNLQFISSLKGPTTMPTPSTFEAVGPLRGPEMHVQSNTFQPSDLNVNIDGKDISDDGGMALVLLDKENSQVKSIQPNDMQQGRLSTLIKGWSASSSTFHRRDSCQFTTCISPCVKKATTHLQELKDQLLRWSAIHEGDTSVESLESAATVMPASRPTTCGDTSAASSIELSSIRFSPVSENIFIDGGQESQFSSASQSRSSPSKISSALEKANTPPKKRCSTQQHMTYVVVEEVIRLLGRMEEDRLSTQEMLITERERVNHLRSQIDELAFKRLVDLPAAVQKEHESCANDINELKWHCAYKGRVEARLRNKVNQAELQHSKIIGEVQTSKERCPLVREKLDLEDIAMASIQSKQDETDEELRQTLKRLEATQQKTKEAKALAAQERALIKKDVDIIRNLLNEISDQLAQVKMNYTSNVHTISDIKNTLKENAEQSVNLGEFTLVLMSCTRF